MPRTFEEALKAIADGVPPAWDDLDATREIAAAEVDGLRLLHDVATAFRDGDRAATERKTPLFQWGPLQVEERLGAGSYGEVWRAYDPWLGRHVALKLHRAFEAGGTRHGDQLEEARRLARVRHPNVLTCHGCAIHDGRAGLWTEIISGRSLAASVADDGALSIEETLRIGRDLARALAAVHAAGLVHGDVKAQNVMRDAGGRVVLMDFGAGGEQRLLAAKRIVSGTPAYLAPEVIEGEPQSTRSDIYALGVLLHLLLAGRLPWSEPDAAALHRTPQARARPRLRDLRPDLGETAAALIDRCLADDPARRPEATQLARDLDAPARHLPRSPSARIPRVAGALVALAVCAALLLAEWPRLFPAWVAEAAFARARAGGDLELAADAHVDVGDRLRLRVTSTRASFVYVLNEDAAGTATVLYPLGGVGSAAIPAGATELPGAVADPTLAWEVTAGSEREEFLVIMALHPLPALEAALADWRRSQAPEVRSTRSLGRVVDAPNMPRVGGAHLQAMLAALPSDDASQRIWRFAFDHALR